MTIVDSVFIDEVNNLTMRLGDMPLVRQPVATRSALNALAEVLDVGIRLAEENSHLEEEWTVQFKDGTIAASSFDTPHLADEYAEEMHSLISAMPDYRNADRFYPARLLKRTVVVPSSWSVEGGFEYGQDIEPGVLSGHAQPAPRSSE